MSSQWMVAFGDNIHERVNSCAGKGCRPLVVIDPEDAEQVEALRAVFRSRECLPFDRTDDWQASLREFATPTPPKPDEPPGLGAVVEDARGRRFTRHCDCSQNPDWPAADWWPNGTSVAGSNVRWSQITAVRVLSEGVPATKETSA